MFFSISMKSTLLSKIIKLMVFPVVIFSQEYCVKWIITKQPNSIQLCGADRIRAMSYRDA